MSFCSLLCAMRIRLHHDGLTWDAFGLWALGFGGEVGLCRGGRGVNVCPCRSPGQGFLISPASAANGLCVAALPGCLAVTLPWVASSWRWCSLSWQ